MKLQGVLLPALGVRTDERLFFYRDGSALHSTHMNYERGELCFRKNAFCSFNGYFNTFCVRKYHKYTNIGDISLKLNLKGRFLVTTTGYRFAPLGGIDRVVLWQYEVDSPEMAEHTFPFQVESDIETISFELESLEEGGIFTGGGYYAEVAKEDLCEVNIALNICTFKREKFVLRNLEILKKAILANPESELYGHFKLYIQDNGKTLPLDEIKGEYVNIVQNKNTGGAGGFTRGMIEVLHDRKFAATHVLMMDDDIVVSIESLYRTYKILSCRKREYADLFIGGAMLRLDSPAVQHESGAVWNAGMLQSGRCNFDLRNDFLCLLNENEEPVEYNAWWYCCTPMSVIKPDNLPMPIFIRGDDLEYGLRNMKHLLLLNGICVWHEPFENKYSSFLNYYILRNTLYVNSLHYRHVKAKEMIRQMVRFVSRELLYFRYLNAELLLRGVSDYLKGVKFLKETDGAALHQEIMKAGYKALPEEPGMDLLVKMRATAAAERPESRRQQIFRFLTLNGLLLPAKKGTPCVPMAGCRPIQFYRAKEVYQYDSVAEKYFVTRRSFFKTMKYLFKLGFMVLRLQLTYGFKKKKFFRESRYLMSEEFWSKYLDLNAGDK